jgi:glycosyltransferase involved in cell wall biosynthesis
MKIAVIAQGAIPAQTANSIQNMKMAGAFADLGHRVQVTAPGNDPHLAWEQLANHYGLKKQFHIKWMPASPILRRYDFAYRAVHSVQEWGTDLVYTRLPQAATLAAQRGLATIFELHDLPSGFMGPWLLSRFISEAGTKRLVVNTRHLAGEIQNRYSLPEDLLTLASNGVDLERYAELPEPQVAREKLGLTSAFTAGYTGHLYVGRGIEFILQIARQMPYIQFLFVGGKPLDVESRKREAGDLKNVHFIGFVPNAELPLYQAACDVFLMPYTSKVAGSSGTDIAEFTNPLKMFEYLACGRPILASDLLILREILTDENAVILPSGDLDTWVQTLLRLHSEPLTRKRLGNAGKDTAALYSWENRALRVLQGIERIAKI